MNSDFQKAEMPGIDHTPAIASNNSGSYTFEPLSKTERTEVKFLGLSDEKIEEEQSEASLYNLLDHSSDDLFELSMAITSWLLKLDPHKERNPEPFKRMRAWEKLVSQILMERENQKL